MKRIKKIIILLFVSLLHYSCTNANAVVNKSKSSAFDKIDKRDKKLFTKQERIESYNNSRNKLTNVKAALKTNSSYSGYGTKKVEKKLTNKKGANTKKISRPKLSNAEFSAYSTN